MTCPYCGKDMIPGRLRAELPNRGGAVWTPEDRTFLPALVLSARATRESAPETGYCMDCHVLIARPEQPEYEQFEQKYRKKLQKRGERG